MAALYILFFLFTNFSKCPTNIFWHNTNSGIIFLQRAGVFYGQCSEICGVNHGFMPIVVKGVSINNYIKWINSFNE